MTKNDAKERIARRFLEESDDVVEQNPSRLKHMLSTDVRDTIPPEIYALIASVAVKIEENLEA